MAKLTILVGLPASGKSIRARELVAQGALRWNNDDFSAMATPDQPWGTLPKSVLIHARNAFILDALRSDLDVVVDDTNLRRYTRVVLAGLAHEADAELEVERFDVDVEECIRRDAQRSGRHHVGEAVIRRLAEQAS